MNKITTFWRNDSGTAEGASAALMVGALSSGLSGAWYQITGNPSLLILLGVAGLLVFWLVFRS